MAWVSLALHWPGAHIGLPPCNIVLFSLCEKRPPTHTHREGQGAISICQRLLQAVWGRKEEGCPRTPLCVRHKEAAGRQRQRPVMARHVAAGRPHPPAAFQGCPLPTRPCKGSEVGKLMQGVGVPL